MDIKSNPTLWVKMGQIHNATLVGKEILCYGIGCHIQFINMTTGENQLYKANFHSENGEGVKLLTGHRTFNFFAFTESCPYPDINIVNYQDFNTYTTLSDENNIHGYLQIQFNDMYQFITLSDLPQFSFTVWNWKLSCKIGEKLSTIKCTNQLLRCNLSKPYYCLQMGIGTNFINVWDIFISCKKCILTQHEINVPERTLKFVDAVWTTEGGLYIIDSKGSVYVMNVQQTLEKVIDAESSGDLNTSMIWYKNGLAVSGPNNEIRHYKKIGVWSCDWRYTPEVDIKKLITNKTEVLLALTCDEEIVKLAPDNFQIEKCFTENQSKIVDFCLILPRGTLVVILRQNNILNIVKCETGVLISTINLKYRALVISENPEYPYICVGYDNGMLEIISFYEPSEPKLMGSIYLTKNPISNIYFCDNGKVFVTCFKDIGEFFILEGTPGFEINVIASIKANVQVVDYMMIPSTNCYRLFLIPVTSHHYLAGNKIVRYCIIDKDTINKKEYELKDPEILYYKIFTGYKHNRDRVFYVLPFKSKFIHELETKRGDNLAELISTRPGGHLMLKMNINSTKYFNITWAPDGFVFIKDKDFKNVIGMALPHHRAFFGVQKACVGPMGKYLISLGCENALVCTQINHNINYNERMKTIEEFMTSPKLQLMFKKRTHVFESIKNMTWLDMEEHKKIKHEQELCKAERKNLFEELNSIKSALKKLIEENEKVKDNQKLDLLEFNLDSATYLAKKQQNEQECINTDIYLRQLIIAQDKVSENLKKYLYDPVKFKSRTMNGIFCNMETANYALIPDDPLDIELFNKFEKYLYIENRIKKNDTFCPWIKIPKEQLIKQLQEQPSMYDTEAVETNLVGDEKSSIDTDTEIALFGTLTPLFIDMSNMNLDQKEANSFYQYQMQNSFCLTILRKLSEYFNKHFDSLRLQKEKDMANILEKNARLRHIVSEINYFSVKKLNIFTEDPKWDPEESPDFFFKVNDNELINTPYVSPSEQAILDAKTAEEERLRLLMLADDFRERALMAMMNGVLEVRWEDELRKEVPIPKCMLEKEPENFNEEDLRAVRDYEQKCNLLNSERERYKNLLANDYSKIGIHIRDLVRKFNKKLFDLLILNTDITSAAHYEKLRIHRQKFLYKKRIQMNEKEEYLKQQIKDNEVLIENIQTLIQSLQKDLVECKNVYDVAQLKEKQLEKLFKRDFLDVSPIIQEQATKLYKKRPKLSLKSIGTSTGLYELSKCVQTRIKEVTLSPECAEYLKALDNLDLFVGVPPTIDENTYSVICKHRRARIEFEVKLRAMQIELLYTESTISTFQRRLHLKKEKNVNLIDELNKLRHDRLHLIHNKPIQMVIKSGLVEVPLKGKIDDFKDVMMVKREEVENVNQLILNAGRAKIKAMKENMALHRRIMLVEWQHQYLKMQIADFNQKILDVEAVNVTKEMQTFLKFKAAGYAFTGNSYEKQLEIMIASFEGEIKEKNDKIIKLKHQAEKFRKLNAVLDKEIKDVNVDVCYYNIQKDVEFAEKEKELVQTRLDSLMKRNNLVNQIQKNQQEIIVLQTELELLRLKTYPTFKYKLIE